MHAITHLTCGHVLQLQRDIQMLNERVHTLEVENRELRKQEKLAEQSHNAQESTVRAHWTGLPSSRRGLTLWRPAVGAAIQAQPHQVGERG